MAFPTIMAKCCHQLQFDVQSIRMNHDNMEPSALHELREIPKAAYWRIGSCCYMSRIAAELHEVLLFIM